MRGGRKCYEGNSEAPSEPVSICCPSGMALQGTRLSELGHPLGETGHSVGGALERSRLCFPFGLCLELSLVDQEPGR